MTKAVSEILELVKALTPKQLEEFLDAIEDSFLDNQYLRTPEFMAELELRLKFIEEHPDQLISEAEADRRIRAALKQNAE